jgi:L-ascorbate metabolism protein UlaG (beta-lactamase superfamily)
MKKKLFFLLTFAFTALFAEGESMAKLLYQGHASFRIVTEENVVVYVDPYAGKGYDVPADLVLITHEHYDHTEVNLVTQKKSCRVVREKELLNSGKYKSEVIDGISVEAVPAYNKNHNKAECVGYVITLPDGIVLYAAGDTSYTDYMKESLSKRHIDYALLPCDGVFNMDAQEASRCADIIGAVHSIPIHTKPGALFDEKVAAQFTAKTRLVVKAGEEITLEK